MADRRDDAEHRLQVRIHAWLEATYDCEVVAVPNGGYRGRLEAIRLREEGVQAGHPDLIVYGPDKVALLEIKTPKGELSASQNLFIPRLRRLGHEVSVVRSLEAVQAIAPTWGLPARAAAPVHVGGF